MIANMLFMIHYNIIASLVGHLLTDVVASLIWLNAQKGQKVKEGIHRSSRPIAIPSGSTG